MSTNVAASSTTTNAVPAVAPEPDVVTNVTQSCKISFLTLQKSGRAIRVSFLFTEGVHKYISVAKVLKVKCDLAAKEQQIAKKIQDEVEAQKKGERKEHKKSLDFWKKVLEAFISFLIFSFSLRLRKERIKKRLKITSL